MTRDSSEKANSTGPKGGQRRDGDEGSRGKSTTSDERMGSSSKSGSRPDSSIKKTDNRSPNHKKDRDD